jgi:hypothetical protein
MFGLLSKRGIINVDGENKLLPDASAISGTHLCALWERGVEAIWVASGASLVVTHWGERLSKGGLRKRRLVIRDRASRNRVKVALRISLTFKRMNFAPLLLNSSTHAGIPRGTRAVRVIDVLGK